MDNFFKSLGNSIYNTVHSFAGGQTQANTTPNPSPNGIQQIAQNFGNWVSSEAGQVYQQAQNIGSSLVNNGIVGFNTGNNPVNNWIAQTPTYIQQGTQAVQNLIPGQNFFGNAARDTVGVAGGILSLPGTLARVQQQPSYALPVLQGIAQNYGNDIGIQNGQWSPQNIGTNFYNRPVSTILDALPFLGVLGKLGAVGKAGEVGEGAEAGSVTSKLQALQKAVNPNSIDLRTKAPSMDDYVSPTEARVQMQPGKDILNELFSVEDQGKAKLDNLMNYEDRLRKSGYSASQLRNISAPMAQQILDQGIQPKDFSNFAKTYKAPDLPDIAKVVGDTIGNKVNVLDYFRTPENVLQKIGLGNEAKQLRTAWDNYTEELPQHIQQISTWAKQVPEAEKTDLYRYLDGRDTQAPLSDGTMQVAQEIKQYLGAWADRLKLPQDSQISNYITHIFPKGATERDFDPDIASLIRGKVAGSVYDPFLQKRTGKFQDLIEDPFQSLDAYAKRATRKANLDPVLEQLSSKGENLEESQYNYLKNYVDRINLRPTDIDNLIDNTIKQSPVGYKYGSRPTAYLTSKARQAVYRGALGLNVHSALTNLTQGVNTYASLGEKYTLLGYSKLVQNLPQILTGKETELERAGVLRDQFVQDRTMSSGQKFTQGMDKGLFYMFETAEKINRGAAYFGAKAKAIAEGKPEEEAQNVAKELVRKTQFSFGNIDTPVALQSDIAKTFAQFQNYGVKQAEFLGGMAKNKDVAGLARYIAASFALVYGVGQLWNMKPTDMIPSVRLGVPPTMQLPAGLVQAATQQNDKYGNPLTPAQRILNSNTVSGAMNLIPAGAQIKKTGSDILENMAGGSYTNAGNLRYPASTDVKGALFGPSYNANAQDYYNKNQNAFSKTETAQYQDMVKGGMSPQAAYTAIRGAQAHEQAFQQTLQPQKQQSAGYGPQYQPNQNTSAKTPLKYANTLDKFQIGSTSGGSGAPGKSAFPSFQ